MSVVSFIKNSYDPDADEPRSRAGVFARMLIILFGGLIATGIGVALVFGVASLIWGGTFAGFVQQISGA